jgi:hypothetical protein
MTSIEKLGNLACILIALTFSGTIFLLAPLDVYVANVDEFAISSRDLVSVLSSCVFLLRWSYSFSFT